MKDTATSLLALGTAFVVAVIVAKLVGPPPRLVEKPAPAPKKPSPPPALVAPLHVPLAVAERVTPPDLIEQADVRAAPWAPGIRLNVSSTSGDWPTWRAHVEDLTSADVRAYAIGDLLPHGSLLVGISTGSADVLVADREIIRIFDDGTLTSWEDFKVASRPSGGPRRVRGPDPAFLEAAQEAIDGLRAEDPAYVQAAIDALVDAGDPVVEQLMEEAESLYPAAWATYSVPSGSGRTTVPKVQGDLVIAILEQITGETFGDPSTAEFHERRLIVERWRRWWAD